MKPFMKSRLGRSLIAIVVTFLTLALRRYMPAEIAEVLSVELVSSLGAALGLGAVGLRVQDRRRVVTAGQLLDRKAAKAAAKIGAGLVLALLAGCGPTWQLCEVDLSNHPVKPRPAASARVRCSRTVLCDVAEGATCDGKKLAEVAK